MIRSVCLGNDDTRADLTAINPNADLEAGRTDDLSTAAGTAHVSDDVLFQPVCCNNVHMIMHQSASIWLADSKAGGAYLSSASATE